MLTSAARLTALPALLVVGAGLCYLTPLHRRGTGRLVAAGTLAVAILLAISVAISVGAGAVIEAAFGEVVPGVGLLLRADAPGITIALVALTAGGLSLVESRRRPREEAAILICVAGSTVAAFAGNAVILFGGAEIGNLGALLLVASGRGRIGRGALLLFVFEHAALLALLLPAAWLQAVTGTSDPTALPAGALSWPLALPWGLAGAARLLSLVIAPGARDPRTSRAWAAIAAVPTGAIILLRLRQAEAGATPLGVTIALAAVGALAALWGAWRAWRWAGDSALAGRGLLIAAVGWPIAMSGLANGDGAFAASFLALELAVLVAPAWSVTARGDRRGRVVAALALVSAGGLPIGFGATATVLCLGAVAAQGRAGTALLATLGTSAVLAAAASLQAARSALGTRAGSEQPLRLDAAVALALSMAGAILPGLASTRLSAALVGGAAVDAPDLATVRGPGGGWPGGYLTVAAVLIVAIVVSGGLLLGRRAPPAARPFAAAPDAPWVGLIGLRRRLAPALHHGPSLVSRLDRWLVPQPQFGLAFAGAFLALLLLR